MIETLDSPHIFAASTEDFQSLVLDNSKSGPVLVNFWSKKAGPCLRQYPILDKLVHEYAGKMLLVNIDTRSEFNVTKTYGITSVPTLKLFRDQVVVETLFGYQSEGELRQVLGQYVARVSDQLLAVAIQQYSEGNRADAYDQITQAIIQDPENPRLPLALGKLLKYERRFADALHLFESLPTKIAANAEITQLKNQLSFLHITDEIDDVEQLLKQSQLDTQNVSHKRLLSAHYVALEQFESALQVLLEIIDIEPDYHARYAQKGLLNIFNLLGSQHALVKQYRPALRRYTH